jgi:hypothetical protein
VLPKVKVLCWLLVAVGMSVSLSASALNLFAWFVICGLVCSICRLGLRCVVFTTWYALSFVSTCCSLSMYLVGTSLSFSGKLVNSLLDIFSMHPKYDVNST